MKQLFLIFTIVFLCNSVYSQYYIKDIKTGECIEFATIFNFSANTGTYSNKSGFKIQATPNDTLIISCVGYYSDTIIYTANLKKEIFLTPKIYQIDEVTLKVDVKSKKHELGFRKERDKTTFYSHVGSEWVAYIENKNPEHTKLIESVILKTSGKRKQNIAYRINIYKKDSITGLPGDIIANLPIFQSKKHKGKKYNLNENLIFPDTGVFVGIEWLSYLDDKGNKIDSGTEIALSVPLTFSVTDSYTYFRSKFHDNQWILAENDHPLSLIQNKDNSPNLAISIAVKEFLHE